MINPKTMRELSSCYILARLADDSETQYIPGLGTERKSVARNQRNGSDIVFYLQTLVDEPKPIKDVGKHAKECYVSFDDRNVRHLQTIKYYEQQDKITFLREHLENKLILIKPKLNHRHDNSSHLYHYNFDIVMVSEDKQEANYYIPVPQAKKGVPSVRFEKALMEGTPITLPDYPNHMETPEFILCDGYLYYIPDQDSIIGSEVNMTIYYAVKPNGIKRVALTDLDDFWSKLKCAYRDIGFITDNYAAELRDTLEKKGVSLFQQEQPKKDEKKQAQPDQTPSNLTEMEFIARLKKLAQEAELVYPEEDLINLHTSLKTGGMAVLGGMSGTGKTRLALLYADALKLKKDENLLYIPISPSYTEPSDILGYLNPQMGLFMESETGLVSFLERASKHTNELFMVLFDEMNLGQVEHYFAPFISLLELPKDQRELRIYSQGAICHNKPLPKGCIPVRDNVLFVGTANFDETTKDFSNRMLDRTNVIFLQKLTFGEASVPKEESREDINTTTPVTRSLYITDWTKVGGGMEEPEILLLDRLHDTMQEYDAQIGVSFRIYKGIGKYLANIPSDADGNALITRNTALDYQVKQRILTKIRGHREQVQDLIGYFDAENRYHVGYIGRLLMEEVEGEDGFNSSLAFLKQKAKELTRNGYVL
ncbi:hypothetical protein B5M42_002230 [Paenibacillus athensensis]|uniref:ATPase dynein-related AAA domain-containing protein n=1 Tax=Paenibacillus athensensis TaxID=1967502 RepID=A0A4Y8QAH1_9BACL|nr:AAA family ATPase [Paenibacillus athensensis]MCD1257656.1 hypothetical protein [Paenibacillus athensensis]